MSEKRWIKRAKLALLSLVGISAVSIPVTVAVALSATGVDSPLALSAVPDVAPAREHPAKAIAKSLKCTPTKGYYALTFDDGPYPETTGRLVAELKKAGAVATFFDVGQRAAARPDLVELQRTAGQVANHSYTHAHLPELSQEQRFQELTATAKVLDHPNAFVRPPFGETSAAVDADMRTTDLVPVYWTTDTRDWENPPVETIVERALTVQPEGIILLHDGRENTLKAVPRIVAGLRERGMCPGLLAKTDKTVVSAYQNTKFNVIAASPRSDRGVKPAH